MNKVVMALGIIAGLLLFGQLDQAEAKGFYGSDLGQTYAVFAMIALAIAGFGILLALYTRETMSVKGH